MIKTTFLPTLVQHKKGDEWEIAFEDVPITFTEQSELIGKMGTWLEGLACAYPPETWEYWTTVSDQAGSWRRAPHLPSGFDDGAARARREDLGGPAEG